MSKFFKVLKVAGDVAEIIVASSIVVELIERYRAKKKIAQVQVIKETANKESVEKKLLCPLTVNETSIVTEPSFFIRLSLIKN